jgi:conjugal transfer pilus assembly protein TraW
MKFLLNVSIIFFFIIPRLGLAAQLGKTYPVTEQSALNEINDKARSFPGLKDIDIKKTTAFKGYPLPNNMNVQTRMISPFYTLEFDIEDTNGNVIYPKGFTFNVGEYVKLPFNVIVFDESQVSFVKAIKSDTDILLLSKGDIIEVNRVMKGNVFYLDSRLAERLYVKGVPTVIRQIGAQYEIVEHVFTKDAAQ